MASDGANQPLVQPRVLRFQATGDPFHDGVTALGLAHQRSVGFAAARWSIGDLEELGGTTEATWGRVGSDRPMAVLSFGERLLVRWEVGGGIANVTVASDDPGRADELCRRLMERFADTTTSEPDLRVPVFFWLLGPHGPEPIRRRIDAPRWADIAANYPTRIRGGVETVMHASRRDVDGIALWHGPPGTGKTTALRALAQEWREWCDLHVIIDPEQFLGQYASYMAQVLFSDEYDEGDLDDEMEGMGVDVVIDGDDDDDDMPFTGMPPGFPPGMMPPGIMPPGMGFGMPGEVMATRMHFAEMDFHERARARAMGGRAKLVVLEDAGELVSGSARAESGQALSRLLNLADGMLGQGANVSVMVTTNEPIESLHPAVQRPGRCWANIEFPLHAPQEAQEWLHEHEPVNTAPGAVHEPVSLAQLFAWKRGDTRVELDNLSAD